MTTDDMSDIEDRPATLRDLRELRHELRNVVTRDELRHELRNFVTHEQLSTELATLRMEVVKAIVHSSNEVRTELRTEMNTRFAQVDARFAQVDARFDELKDDLARHVNTILSAMRTQVAVVDDKYLDVPGRVASLEQENLPARVDRLEQTVFPPRRQRKR